MRDDPIEIRKDEPDPFWVLLAVAVFSALAGVAIFLLAVYQVI